MYIYFKFYTHDKKKMSCQLGLEKFYVEGKKLVIKGWLNNNLDYDIFTFDKLIIPFNKDITKCIAHDSLGNSLLLRLGSFDFISSVYYIQDVRIGSYLQVHFKLPTSTFVFLKRSTENFEIKIPLTGQAPSNLMIIPNLEEGIGFTIDATTGMNETIHFSTSSPKEFYGLDGTLESPHNSPSIKQQSSTVSNSVVDMVEGIVTKATFNTSTAILYVVAVIFVLLLLYYLFMKM